MVNSFNVSLTDELRAFVNERASGNDVYSTPSEYIRDLIRRDMEEQSVVRHVMRGLGEVKQKRFSAKSITDIVNGE